MSLFRYPDATFLPVLGLAALLSAVIPGIAPGIASAQSLIDEMESNTRTAPPGNNMMVRGAAPPTAGSHPERAGSQPGPGSVPGSAPSQKAGGNAGGGNAGGGTGAGTGLDLGQVHRAWDRPVAAPGQIAPGKKFITYDERRTVELRTRQFMPVMIHFPPCETIDPRDVILGDGEGFAAVPMRANVLAVYTKHEGIDSSVEAIGSSGRVYTFYVRAVPLDAPNVSDLSVQIDAPGLCERDQGPEGIRTGRNSRFPASAGFAEAMPPVHAGSGPVYGQRRASMPADYLREVSFDPDRLDFESHRMFAARPEDSVIAPERVYSDGRFIYLDYGSRASQSRWPVVYMTVDGVDEPVNTRVVGERGQILMVMAMGDVTLKSGQAVICIRQRRDADLPDRLTIDRKLGKAPADQPSGGQLDRDPAGRQGEEAPSAGSHIR